MHELLGLIFLQYGFPEASYSVVTTLCFVSPASALPQIVKQLQDDLDPASLNALSDFDLGVWATPEGTTFVDGYFFVLQRLYHCVDLKPFFYLVLSSTKGETRPNKGKDYEIAKWEEEIRKSLATKKATPVTLSKQQQALIQSQLEKEAKIRRHVQDICANLTRGLHLVRSIVTAGVDEFHSYMTSVLSLLLNGALSRGSFLVGAIAFDTYLVCSSTQYSDIF